MYNFRLLPEGRCFKDRFIRFIIPPRTENFAFQQFKVIGWRPSRKVSLCFQEPNYWVLKGSRALTIRSLEA